MLVKQFKNSRKEIYFNKISDLYKQLTSLGSIFQRTTFFTHYSEHLSMDASEYLYQFCEFCVSLLKSFDRKNRICKQFSLKLLVRKFLLFRGFLGTCCQIIKKIGNQLNYFQAPQSSYCDYVSMVFSTSTRRQNLVEMPIISGDKWL